MPNLDEKFMSLAIKQAELAVNEANWPVGCVIVLNEKVIAQEHNTGFTDKNRLAHAELKALVSAKDILEKNRGKATLYTTYEPCPMCFGAMVMMKIARVVTGVDLDQSGCLDMQKYLPKFFQQEKFKFAVTRGILATECKNVFSKNNIGRKHLEKVKKNMDYL